VQGADVQAIAKVSIVSNQAFELDVQGAGEGV